MFALSSNLQCQFPKVQKNFLQHPFSKTGSAAEISEIVHSGIIFRKMKTISLYLIKSVSYFEAGNPKEVKQCRN